MSKAVAAALCCVCLVLLVCLAKDRKEIAKLKAYCTETQKFEDLCDHWQNLATNNEALLKKSEAQFEDAEASFYRLNDQFKALLKPLQHCAKGGQVKVGIVADNYKLPMFEKELEAQGFTWEKEPYLAGCTTLRVECVKEQVPQLHTLCVKVQTLAQERKQREN